LDAAGLGPSDQLALQRIARRLADDQNCEVFFDIRPLFDDEWTGIPVVAASLARVLIPVFGSNLRFFFRRDEVRADAVYDALSRSTGCILRQEFNHGDARLGPVRRSGAKRTIGLFPSAKSARRLFDYECSIVHDISTLITPQYHTLENIAYHMEFIAEDIASNAVTACISQATARDLTDYLGVPPEKLVVAYNGVSWRKQDLAIARREVDPDSMEPFFLILGTREPRKNVALIVELLCMFPELLASHRFVFTGRIGWLQEQQTIPPMLAEAVNAGRVLFTGFLPDTEKCKLVMAAEAMIFPSLHEGFGLPVVESLSVGTPCIASCSSSIPEVGAEFCTYFDPYSVLDLRRAIGEFNRDRPKRNQAFRNACMDSVARFSWPRSALQILGALGAMIGAEPRG